MRKDEYNLHRYYLIVDGKEPHLWLRTSGLLVTSYTLADNMTEQDARYLARLHNDKFPSALYNEFHELVSKQFQERAKEADGGGEGPDLHTYACEEPKAEPFYYAFYINKDNPELALDYLEGDSGNKFVSLLDYVDASTINPVRSDELGAFNLDNFYVIRSEKEHITLKDVFRVLQNSK